MSKRKRRKHSPQPSAQDFHVSITREQLAEAIALGIEQAEARRRAAEKKEKDEAYEQWCIQIKRPKNYDRLKGWKAFCADWRVFVAMICMSFRRRKVKEGPLVLHNFIALLLSMMFACMRWFLIVGGIACAAFSPVTYLLGKATTLNLTNTFTGVILGFLLIGFSAIFKFIADEISVIKDTALLIALMSLFLALASVIISIVT